MEISDNLYKGHNRFQISIVSPFIFGFRVNSIEVLNFINFEIRDYQNLMSIFL